MSEMWFLLGVLCGAAVGVFLPKKSVACKKVTAPKTAKGWGETHNFLYYDGTEMPIVKEDLNEQ